MKIVQNFVLQIFNRKSNLKKGYIFFILYAFAISCKKDISNPGNSNSDIFFFKGSKSDKVIKVKPTSDHGFIYCGNTSNDSANVDGFMLKIDAAGNQQWYKKYGGLNYDDFNDVIECSDGGFMAVGSTNSIGFGSTSGKYEYADYFVKTNRNGEVEWSKSYATITTILRSVMEMPDHRFIAVGSCVETNWNICFYKLSGDGNLILKKTNYAFETIAPFFLSKRWHEHANFVGLSKSGEIMIGGMMDKSYNSLDVGSHLTFFMLTNINGNPKSIYIDTNNVRVGYFWFSLTPYRFASVKIISVDDGYFLGTDLDLPGSMKIQLMKLDLNGKQLWEKKYIGLKNSIFYNMELGNDGALLLTGAATNAPINYSFQEGFSYLQGMLKKTDADGNELWATYTGSSTNTTLIKATSPLTEGGWTVAGLICSNETGYDKIFCLNIDEVGKLKVKQ